MRAPNDPASTCIDPGALRVIPQIRVPKPPKGVITSFMRSGEWIQVVQSLQRHMQMAPNYVGRRKRLPGSSAEQESNLAAANELFEPSGNRRVKIDLTDGIRSLEPLFDLSATNLLLDVKGQEIGRDVFIDFDAKHLSDS